MGQTKSIATHKTCVYYGRVKTTLEVCSRGLLGVLNARVMDYLLHGSRFGIPVFYQIAWDFFLRFDIVMTNPCIFG